MTTASRLTQTLLVTALTLAATSAAFAQRPDLNGTFTNMSLTGLSRPEGVEPLIVNADLAQQIAAGWPLHRHVVQLVRRGPHKHLQLQFFRQLAQPFPAVIRSTDPAEVILAQPEHCAVVNHAAVLIAHGGIDHLTDRQFLHVARHAPLHQCLGIRAGHFEFAERRQVQDHGGLTAGPILLDRAV